MWLESTRRQSPAVTFRQALMQGLAPDGGLYLPTSLPVVDRARLESLRGSTLGEIAVRLSLDLLAGELAPGEIEQLVGDAMRLPVPTVHVEGRLHVLELFHGPTLAFKDFGARFLARLFGHFLGGGGREATILVATSGDTGSAVAHGFFGVPHVRVVLLYPAGKVSPFQESQMATLGGNVTAVAIPGTFDDCQRLVKRAFLDPDLRRLNLSSANSINIGRLLPQSFYYFAGYLPVAAPGDRVVFAVPSGNLGNLTAGVIAQRMGLPVSGFVAASNLNDVLPEYLATGRYRARAAMPTLSNAMDVGDPSNFERLLSLHGSRVEAMRENLAGVAVGEEETRQTISAVYRRAGYVLDPHGAVGYAAAEQFLRTADGDFPVVCLATAHPGKFGQPIAEELGFEPPLPAAHRDWRTRPLLAIRAPDAGYETFRDLLRQRHS